MSGFRSNLDPHTRGDNMSEKVNLAIVGCGGMGRRHLAGLAELARTDHNNIALKAVCDLDESKAESLASEAESLLGHRPSRVH